MSGWIKLEKDLREDVRVKRMATALEDRLQPCNACALLAVTLVLGGLAQLWMYADTFARDDDTLDLRADEIDKLTGIEGFAQLLPEDWLQILEGERVKLPGFQEHNGSEAKRRALTAKRVARHRDSDKRNGVTPTSNPVTHVRYQTRPDQDQTKTKTIKKEVADAPVVAGLNPIAWETWEGYRKQIGRPIKPASRLLAQKKLATYGDTQAEVVDQSIAQGWQGLFPLKGNGHAKAKFVPALSTEELEALEAEEDRRASAA